ncbi:hypothetical protein BKA66DRAFT_165581 [Pyrenochaeta sp. MPI-SDFR-AT-0127]|nr:hypothetical protein BKA66DRAFT_165581 [Pyrenochaeta sp. MPI-SDFR-AT-0127]
MGLFFDACPPIPFTRARRLHSKTTLPLLLIATWCSLLTTQAVSPRSLTDEVFVLFPPLFESFTRLRCKLSIAQNKKNQSKTPSDKETETRPRLSGPESACTGLPSRQRCQLSITHPTPSQHSVTRPLCTRPDSASHPTA